MKALSIRQPWVCAILELDKDIENRDWSTNMRGTIAIHAAKGLTNFEYSEALAFMYDDVNLNLSQIDNIPRPKEITRGAIVGLVDITDCVTKSPSPWFQGRFGFVLENPRALKEPIPYSGALGFWDVPADVEARILETWK